MSVVSFLKNQDLHKEVHKKGLRESRPSRNPFIYLDPAGGDLNPRPDDYELDRPGGLVLAPVGRWLPALEKIASGRVPISRCLPLLSPVWCTKSVQSDSLLVPLAPPSKISHSTSPMGRYKATYD